MIDLYTWSTPNGWKASIMLEETGLPYEVHPIPIGTGVQKQETYRAIAPHMRIPAIVDGDDGQAIFESGAILLHLAEKSGQLLAASGPERRAALSWLFFQVGQVGPFFGNLGAFRNYKGSAGNDAGIERFAKLSRYVCEVLDRRLGEAEFLAGSRYSIADVATFPWIRGHEWVGVSLEDHPNLRRWLDAIGQRPAVARGLAVPHPVDMDDAATRASIKAQGSRIAD